MRYAGIITNDTVNGNGVCVSFFVQGCPLRCKECHNKESWDFNGGLELPEDYKEQIKDAMTANGVLRNFSLLGGEPLCKENLNLSLDIVSYIRGEFGNKVEICVWSGYRFEDLLSMKDQRIDKILNMCDILVDGPYNSNFRDISLKMKGSSNQRIIDLKKSLEGNNVIIKTYTY